MSGTADPGGAETYESRTANALTWCVRMLFIMRFAYFQAHLDVALGLWSNIYANATSLSLSRLQEKLMETTSNRGY